MKKYIPLVLAFLIITLTACNKDDLPITTETTTEQTEPSAPIETTTSPPKTTSGRTESSATTAGPEPTTEITEEPPELLEVTAETTVTVTTTAVTTSPPPVVAAPAANIKELINATPLTPMATQNKEMDAKINQIIGTGGSAYDKVVRGYDWLIRNVTYVEGGIGMMVSDVYLPNSHPDYYGEYGNFHTGYLLWSYPALIQNKGVCDNFSTAFVLMARSIGLEAYAYTGQVKSKSGGYRGHTWAGIVLNGTVYIFDPQVEQNNLGANSVINYSYFGKTASQMSSTYIWDAVSGYSAIFGEASLINHYISRASKWDYVVSSVADIEQLINTKPVNMSQGGRLILTGLLPKKEVDAVLNKYYDIPVPSNTFSESVLKAVCDTLLEYRLIEIEYGEGCIAVIHKKPVNPDLKPSDLTAATVYFELKKTDNMFGNTPGTVNFGTSHAFGWSFHDKTTGHIYYMYNGNEREIYNKIINTHPAYQPTS
ncbi:MAG: transglutaminase-like domain-containing protein [Oscillospiraceae bacterium]|nr:transglutaminase-like domain-containing protein [Oscillospiraceae bacterium]